MNNYNPYFPIYYPILMLPNSYSLGCPIYPTMQFCPQIVPTPTINSQVNLASFVANDQEKKMEDPNQKSEEKIEPKPVQKQSEQRIPSSKQQVQPQSNATKQGSLKSKSKKSKRPQTYLTQKAFYMKQKLKEKQRNGIRILRKRKAITLSTKNKTNQADKSRKKQREDNSEKVRKMPIMKHSQKQRKIINKIRQKLIEQVLDQNAKIPKLISGIVELNQFCRQKMQNLMKRRVSKD